MDKEWLNILRGGVLVVAPIGFFFQRDLPFTYLFSVNNTTWFLAYWLFIPMAIWFTIETLEKLEENTVNLKSNSIKREGRELAVQREREFIKKSVASSKADSKEEQRKKNLRAVTWQDKSTSIGRKPIQSFVLGDEPSDYWFRVNKINKSNFNVFMSEKKLRYNQMILNPIGIVNRYKKWLSTPVGKLHSTKKKKPVTVKKETTEDKLKNLKDLYDRELISREVYEKKQLEILSE